MEENEDEREVESWDNLHRQDRRHESVRLNCLHSHHIIMNALVTFLTFLGTTMSGGDNDFQPRTGLPLRLTAGPKAGQRSLYQQQVLDVSD